MCHSVLSCHGRFIDSNAFRRIFYTRSTVLSTNRAIAKKNYVLGLVEILTFNSILNIDSNNNKFYVAGHVVSLPVGSY